MRNPFRRQPSQQQAPVDNPYANLDDFPTVEEMRTIITKPTLQSIRVEPVMYAGEAIKHKLIMQFDTGEIVIGMAQNADGLYSLRLDILKELGMPEAPQRTATTQQGK